MAAAEKKSYMKPFNLRAQLGICEKNSLIKMNREAETLLNEIRKLQKDDDVSAEKSEKNPPLNKLDAFKIKCKRKLSGHNGRITSIHWAADGRRLVSASQDKFMFVWNTETKMKEHAIELANSWSMTCAYSPSASFVASAGMDNVCSIYSLEQKGVLKSTPQTLPQILSGHDGFISCCRFRMDSDIITSSGDTTCMLWDLETGAKVQTFEGHTQAVMSLSLSSNFTFVSASSDCSAKVWDTRARECCGTFTEHAAGINGVAFYPSGDAFATGSEDKSCIFFDIRAQQSLCRYGDHINVHKEVSSVAFSASGRLLFAANNDSNCYVWDTLENKIVGKLKGHEGSVNCVDVVRDSIATSGFDDVIRLWKENPIHCSVL